MKADSVAPCGVICDLCYGYQRNENRCAGCNHAGWHPKHWSVCRIRGCTEKGGDAFRLCSDCHKFPCTLIRHLDTRYRERYGESPIGNLKEIQQKGMSDFIENQELLWRCTNCGARICVHRSSCLFCGESVDKHLDGN